ncbi:hypothetical protein QR680_001880 [Steinernema hermaphroditum]|uniref:Acireductone dioxygenase n=1 Tax=Steinernema hermaphroditum TaxID=289476 RepID=A0AA39H155_9BILA|nr:hypothetical protein QR680_001880 [Steinernema hermaphroditum]
MEKQEFQKFTKYFCTRLIQSVVQARTGEEVGHGCIGNPETSDWFNFRVDELGEITAYIRSSVQGFPPTSKCLNLDFFLYTAFGDYLPLESWRITIDEQKSDPLVSVRGGFYHQLGTLLKSVAAAARVTPLYRYYVKKQGADTFVAFYRIYDGASEIDLGPNKTETRLGCLPSPFGSLCVDLSYRTTMELASGQPLSKSAYCPKDDRLREKGKLASASCPRFIPMSTKVPSDLKRRSDAELTSPVEETVTTFSISPSSPIDVGDKKVSFHMGQSSSSEDVSTMLGDQRCRTLKIADDTIAVPADLTGPPLSRLRHCSTVPTACNLLDKTDNFAILKEDSDEPNRGEDDSDEDRSLSAIHMLSFSTTDDLGSDLKELVQRCQDAPTSLLFMDNEQNYSNLQSLLSEYENRKNGFDEFIAKEMVKAWYMSNSIVDQRKECHLSPPEFCSLEKLAEIGVTYRLIPTDEKDTGLELVCAEQGYDYRDEIVINREKLPNYDEKIKTFFEEHLHTDDEARYVAKGSGYFDVRDKEDRWIRVLTVEGDLLILPAGIYHRFTVDDNDYINAIRLFKGVPVWKAYNRGEESENMPIRHEYVNTI